MEIERFLANKDILLEQWIRLDQRLREGIRSITPSTGVDYVFKIYIV